VNKSCVFGLVLQQAEFRRVEGGCLWENISLKSTRAHDALTKFTVRDTDGKHPGTSIPAGGKGGWFPGLLIPRGNPMPAQSSPSRNMWWCREGSCTSSAYRLSRWPGEPQPGFIMPERHGSHPGAVGSFLSIQGPGGSLSSPTRVRVMDSWRGRTSLMVFLIGTY